MSLMHDAPGLRHRYRSRGPTAPVSAHAPPSFCAARPASRLFLGGGSCWGGPGSRQPRPPPGLPEALVRVEVRGLGRSGVPSACGRLWGWWVPSLWGGGRGGRCVGVRGGHRGAEGEGWKGFGQGVRNRVRTLRCPSAFDTPVASPQNLLWWWCGPVSLAALR